MTYNDCLTIIQITDLTNKINRIIRESTVYAVVDRLMFVHQDKIIFRYLPGGIDYEFTVLLRYGFSDGDEGLVRNILMDIFNVQNAANEEFVHWPTYYKTFGHHFRIIYDKNRKLARYRNQH